jgi:hypothetical protein
MRAGTLSDPETLRFLRSQFVLVTHNQLPQLYCTSATVDTSSKKSYPKEQLATVTEGAGGGNIRSYFCLPDGRVVGFIAGYWKPTRYREEARWMLERMKSDVDELGQQHWHRAAALESQRNQFVSPADVKLLLSELSASSNDAKDPESRDRFLKFRQLAAFNRLIRSYRESREIVLWPIGKVLRKVEDEVYTKGAIGCDS